jgi:hypothetical protein
LDTARHCNGRIFDEISVGVILQWSTLGYCSLNTYERIKWYLLDREAARHCNGRIFDEISKDTISAEVKIHCTASKLDKTWQLGWNLL